MIQLVVVISGAALIVLGAILVVVQMILQNRYPKAKHASRSLDVSGPFKIKAALKTTYVGLLMILLGIVLELVGYLATAPWKNH